MGRKSILVTVVLAGVAGLGYAAQQAGSTLAAGPVAAPRLDLATPSAPQAARSSYAADGPATPAAPSPAAPRSTPTAGPEGDGGTSSASPAPRRTLVARPTPAPVVRVLGPGDRSDAVRDLQARLKQLAWYVPDVTGHYDATTRAAVRGFQAKRGIRASGVVDPATLRRLHQMSSTPSHGQKHNVVAQSAATRARLDPRCTSGRAICVDKTSQTLRWVVDGRVRATMAVRFGAAYSPTREGLFHVGTKSADHVSRLYGSAMPYAMFFSGGQAVHYSSDFAARGYAGASHGCVNVRDRDGIRWLFGQVRVGDAVVVYRS